MVVPLVKPVVCPALIGRGSQLSALHGCVREAASGHGQTILLAGEAGIGKSRLAAEVSDYAASCGLHIVTGHCFEEDEAVPYAPFYEILETLLKGALGRIPPEAVRVFAPDLTRLVPELATQFPDLSADPVVVHEPEQEKRRFARALMRLVREIAARQPLFILIEDVHWCDEASLDALLSLARVVAAQPVVMVLTYRHDEPHAHLGHMLTLLDRERLAAEVRLQPLSVTEVEGMLRAIFGQDQPVRADLLNLVCGLSDGNPYFVEELLRACVDAGATLSPGPLSEHSPVDVLRVPRSVEEAVQRRAARLTPPARQLVALAAVVGRTFTFALLQELAQQGEQEVLAQLKQLIAAQLVVEVSDERFAFRHALTRQAVCAGLLARERQRLHRRIAAVLEPVNESLHDAHLGDLAYHFSQAAIWDKALAYARRAGERALALYAPRSALEHLARAVEAAVHLPNVPLAPLHRLCGQAYEILGDFEAARTSYGAALATAQASRDDATEWQSLIDLGSLWTGRDYAQAGAFYQQASELAQSREDVLLHAHSLNRLGNWFVNTGRMEQGIAAHRRALALFAERGEVAGQAATLDLSGMAYGLNAELPSATREFGRAIELLRSLGDRRGLVLSLASRLAFGSGCMADTTVSALMSLDKCLRDAHEAERHAREMEWSAGLAYVLLQTGRTEVACGVLGSGMSHTREALRIAREIRHQQWIAAAHYALGRMYVTLLLPACAIPELETGLTLAREVGSAVWIGLATADLAHAYCQQGEFARAETLLSEALPLEVLSGRSHLTLTERELALQWARFELQRGHPEMALEIVSQLEETLLHSDARDQPVTEVLLVQGGALMRLRRWDEAERELRSAERGGIQRMNPSSLWQVHVLLARLYRTTKREELARQEWSAARGHIEQLAVAIEEVDIRDGFLHAAMEDLPKAARAPHPLSVPHSLNVLTTREREVAELISQGKSNHEIAGALVVSERTVTTHVSNILGKLAFTSRTQIVAWMFESATHKP